MDATVISIYFLDTFEKHRLKHKKLEKREKKTSCPCEMGMAILGHPRLPRKTFRTTASSIM